MVVVVLVVVTVCCLHFGTDPGWKTSVCRKTLFWMNNSGLPFCILSSDGGSGNSNSSTDNENRKNLGILLSICMDNFLLAGWQVN